MKINQKGIDLVKYFEGLKLDAYLDPIKIPTIGYGATFYKDGTKVKMGDKVTQQQAETLLKDHINSFAERVKNLLKSELTENQFSAVTSFAYNCGIGNLKVSTLLKKVNANPNDETIRTEFMKWDKAGGKPLAGLTKRRKAEADLYFTK